MKDASPGSAGCNRTLGLKAPDGFQVPAPDHKLQCWSDEVYQRMEVLKKEQAEVLREVDAILAAVLDNAFRGELVL